VKAVLRAALTIAQLPAKATVGALKSTFTPAAANTLATAIAQGSLQVADQDEQINVNGLDVQIDFNEERLLTTAGISTAIALGTVYWIGSKLKIQYRYDAMVAGLTSLRSALADGDVARSKQITAELDLLSNPLIDPETLQPIDASDEVKATYEYLFKKPAENGSMFNTAAFTEVVDNSITLADDTARVALLSQTDEVLESMIKKAKPIAGTAAGRLVGAVLWVDTVWWVATSALDLALNFTGISEENQRIPILADIPVIGALFDLSDSTGSSFVDLVLTPLLDGIISLFSAEDEVQILVDTMWGIITSAALNPTLLPFIIAILDFYIDDVQIDFTVPATFNIQGFKIDYVVDLFGFRPDPTDILILWLYAITGKIVFKYWIVPAFNVLRSR
jgi:hypothetical protein